MAAPLADVPSWDEIKRDLNLKVVDQISELVGSGTKTAGAKRFFGWVASSSGPEAKWMREYLANDNRDVDDVASTRRVHHVIETWTAELLELKIWKSTSVRGQRTHLLDAFGKLREIDPDSFPIIDPRLMPIGAHHDSKGHTALGELNWEEYANTDPAQRDAVGLALVRSAALGVFERQEAIYRFGQSVLNEKSPPPSSSHWHTIRTLICEEIDSWEKNRYSQFSKKWDASKSELIGSLSAPSVWRDLGLNIDFPSASIHFSNIADLILACIGPTFRLNQAIQTIFCCDSGWNRGPIQLLPAWPFAVQTDNEVYLGSDRVLASLKLRAGHVVHADPANATIVRGIAAADFNSQWSDVAGELKLEDHNEQLRLQLDSDLLDLLQRYKAIQALSSKWTNDETKDLFFHVISQRAPGVWPTSEFDPHQMMTASIEKHSSRV